MASVFYGIEFETIVVMMRKQLSSFPLTTDDEAKYLIRSFVTYMADKIHKDRAIDTFVLFIDEALSMEEHIVKRYPDSTEITSCVRCALLNKDVTFNGGPLKIALAISSLSVSPIQETKSNRAVQAIVLPSTLNKADVVTKIWNRGNRSNVSPADNYRLQLIAATVNNVPRCVEMVNDYIRANQTDPLIINKEFVKGLYEYLDKQIKLRYGTDGRSPSDELLAAVIFGDGVELDSKAESLISYSIITNSIDGFKKNRILEKPEMSLAMMRYVTSIGVTALAKAISGGITAVIGNITADRGEGYIWEVAYYEWMKIRLRAASSYVPKEHVRADRKVMSIKKLFGITNDDIIPSEHYDLFSASLELQRTNTLYWKEVNLMKSSRFNPTSFLEEIDNIKLSAESPVAIVLPMTGEAWDLCLKILVPGYDEPMYVFVENKAIQETQKSADKVLFNMKNKPEPRGEIEVGDFEDGGKQYTHTETVMGPRKIVFIYARTQKSVSYGINNAIELGRDDSFGFLGPLSDLYQAAMSTSTNQRK